MDHEEEPQLPLNYRSWGNQAVFHAAEPGCPLGEGESMGFHLRIFHLEWVYPDVTHPSQKASYASWNTMPLEDAEHSPTALGRRPALWQALKMTLMQTPLEMPRTTPNSNVKVIGGTFTQVPCLIKGNHAAQHFSLGLKEP